MGDHVAVIDAVLDGCDHPLCRDVHHDEDILVFQAAEKKMFCMDIDHLY